MLSPRSMQDVVVDRARVIAPPPLIYLAMLGVGLMLEWLCPTRLLSRVLAQGVGVVLFVFGVIGLTVAIRTVLRAQTPVNPYKPVTTLVTNGLYRFSRNPIYVSDTIIYLGLAIGLNAWWAVALTPILIWIVQIGVIAREEGYLEKKFGNEYARYKQQVRRWI